MELRRRGSASSVRTDFDFRLTGDPMALNRLMATAVLTLWPVLATAQPNDWHRYVVAETGTAVDLPRDIFSDDAGKPETGYGGRFLTSDRRANLTVHAVRNEANDTPAAFLAKKNPPPGIVYRRVTANFFVVSSFRNGLIWYDRCNFAGRFVTCILINYPAAEKKRWDAVVTRISNSLSKS
jgi:hypothetical protein